MKSPKDTIINMRVNKDLKEQFRQVVNEKGFSISNYLHNFMKSEIENTKSYKY